MGDRFAYFAKLHCFTFEPQTSNLRHPNTAKEYPKGLVICQHKVNSFKNPAKKQTNLFRKSLKHSATITLVSYQLAWNIARAKKPYCEGEFVKTCLKDVVAILAPENEN